MSESTYPTTEQLRPQLEMEQTRLQLELVALEREQLALARETFVLQYHRESAPRLPRRLRHRLRVLRKKETRDSGSEAAHGIEDPSQEMHAKSA